MNILQWIDLYKYKRGFLSVNKNYSTCIPFLPSEVTKELVRTIVAMKLLSQSTTTTMLLHLRPPFPTHALAYMLDQNK
jgi:hypothetical protein